MTEPFFTKTVTTILSSKTTKRIENTNKELDFLQENIIVAPISIAILGHVMLLSTIRDFSLISKPRNNPGDVALYANKQDFRYITQPESFRATLVQVSDVIHEAFFAVHLHMYKIATACDYAQYHVKLITASIFEGVNSDMNTLVPNSLKSMRETADGCTQWSREIQKEFHFALALLEEVHCSCHATQMTNQEKLNELERQRKRLESENKESERSKSDKEEQKQTLENKMNQELYKYERERQITERRIRYYQDEVRDMKNELRALKREQDEANNDVRWAYDNRGFGSWFFGYKTFDIEDAERRRDRKNSEVREKERELRSKERYVENEVRRERTILKEKKEAMLSAKSTAYQDIADTKHDINEISNKTMDTIRKLNANDLTKLDLESVKNLLREGIEKIAELEGHWKNLVIFFEAIGNITEIVLGKAIEDFTDTTEKVTKDILEESDSTMSDFRKKMILKFALETYSRCNAVGKVSKSYLTISKNHLMPSLAELNTISRLDSHQDAEKINEKKRSIQTKCEKTVNYVKEVIKLAKMQNEIQVRIQAFQLK